MKIRDAEVFRYDLPLAAPLVLHGAALERREGLLLKLSSGDGLSGWGEAAPLPGFSRETLPEAEIELLRRAAQLKGRPAPLTSAAIDAMDAAQDAQAASVSFAVHGALLNLASDIQTTTPRYLLSPGSATSAPLNALLQGAPGEVVACAKARCASGFTALKLKVGRRGAAEEADLACAVREAIGPDIALRLDANRAWDLETAADFAARIAGCNVEYIEEPLHDPRLLPEFLARTKLPYALDETFQEAVATLRAPGRKEAPACPAKVFGQAAACIWKPTLVHYAGMGAEIASGGLGLPLKKVIVTGAFESGVGISMLAQFAAAYAGPDAPAGLDTYACLAGDVLEARLPLDGGAADLRLVHAAASAVDVTKLTRLHSM